MSSYLNLSSYLKILKEHEQSDVKVAELDEIKILIDQALDKLDNIGYPAEPLIKLNNTMEQYLDMPEYLSLPYTEAIRLLLIADFYQQNKIHPTLNDLAMYKSDEPSKDDAANEGRILNLLEIKDLVTKTRSGSKMSQEKLIVSNHGKQMINGIVKDARYLRKVYNRSRNQKLRVFILKFIDKIQMESQLDLIVKI